MSFNSVSQIYDESRGAPSSDAIKFLVSELRDCECETLLDIGIGTGRFAEPLRELGFDVTGIDISPNMIKQSRERGVESLVVGDAQNLPFTDGAFDSALLVHMLHLIRDWSGLLSEIRRTVRMSLLSVAGDFGPKERSMRHLYLKMVRSCGYEQEYDIEGKELDLAKVLEPRKIQTISSTRGKRKVDEIIDLLDERKTSIAWGVPEGMHKKVISELRQRFGGKEMGYDYYRYLITWDVENLQFTSARKASSSPG
ncbi:MAG: class I SAM-dependent methyltransferase [Candidatus Bathyarchaeota archaeon]|nr:class I SAM-dependent methyltransferase [Candidatus Bathyarchaeota archaeon]